MAKRKIVGIVILGLSLGLTVFGSLFFYSRAFADRIYKNVYVANVDLSGLSKEQAAFVLEKHFNQLTEREITLRAGGQELKTYLSDTGVGFNVNQIVDNSYNIGRESTLYGNLATAVTTLWQKKRVAVTPRINSAKYETFTNLVLPKLNQAAVDATLKIEDGNITETKEVVGHTIDAANLAKDLLSLVYNPSETALELTTKTINPEARAQDFSEAKQFAEAILQKQITLSYENFSFTPNKTELGNWIAFSNQDGKITGNLDDSAIKTYLNKIASNFEVQKVNRKINAIDNSVIIEGQAGKYLDKDSALTAIKSVVQINSPNSISLIVTTKEPEEEKVVPAEGLIPGRFSGKYIDVDLANQQLCLVNSSNVEKCHIVSTGKPSMPTPTGTRLIDGKHPRAWSAKYGLWMPYWQSLGGGYGIHELPEWPSGYKEGEAHLGHPVSHGCIRLGIGGAGEVYNWTEIGTPVYIHK